MNTFIMFAIIICIGIVIIDVMGSVQNMYQARQQRLWLEHLTDNGLYQDDKGLVYPIKKGGDNRD